jgi:hypothetical protein
MELKREKTVKTLITHRAEKLTNFVCQVVNFVSQKFQIHSSQSQSENWTTRGSPFVIRVTRGPFLTSPLGANFGPGGQFCPLDGGEVIL